MPSVGDLQHVVKPAEDARFGSDLQRRAAGDRGEEDLQRPVAGRRADLALAGAPRGQRLAEQGQEQREGVGIKMAEIAQADRVLGDEPGTGRRRLLGLGGGALGEQPPLPGGRSHDSASRAAHSCRSAAGAG